MQTYLEKRNATRNQARFYRMQIEPNLFACWTLRREWGRIGQGGKVRRDWFDSEALAIATLIDIESGKRRRGYWVAPQQLTLFQS